MLPQSKRSLSKRLVEATERNATLVEQQAQAATLAAANLALLAVWIDIRALLERIATKLESEPGPPGP